VYAACTQGCVWRIWLSRNKRLSLLSIPREVQLRPWPPSFQALSGTLLCTFSPLSIRTLGGRRNRSVYSNDFEQLSANVFFLSRFVCRVAEHPVSLFAPPVIAAPSRATDTKSCCDDAVRSKSFDIAHGRLAKEAAVFSVELADALVANLVSCARGVHPIHKHPLPCPLQPQLLLVLKRAHRGQCTELMMKC
jgi:hypothetical protein